MTDRQVDSSINTHTSEETIQQQKQKDAAKQVAKWYGFFRDHRDIPPASLFSYQPLPEPKIYRVLIPRIEIRAHLYNAQQNLFFGRSYISSLGDIFYEPRSRLYYTTKCFNIYFHTRIPNEMKLSLIVEIILTELDQRKSILNEMTVGWSELSFIQDYRKVVDIDVYEGSGRLILTQPFIQDRRVIPRASLFYRAFSGELDQNITWLIGESMLCGSEDLIPGLQGYHLPNFNDIDEHPAIQLKTAHLYSMEVSDFKLTVPADLDNQIIQRAREVHTRLPSSINFLLNAPLKIGKRQLKVAFHNGWTTVSDGGLETPLELVPNPNNPEILEYKGKYAINRIILENYTALIIQLEYVVQVPLNAETNFDLTIVIGWTAHTFDETYFGMKRAPLREVLVTGKGRSINFEPLFSVELGHSNGIPISGVLNLQKLPRSTHLPVLSEIDEEEEKEIDMSISFDKEGFLKKHLARSLILPQIDIQGSLSNVDRDKADDKKPASFSELIDASKQRPGKNEAVSELWQKLTEKAHTSVQELTKRSMINMIEDPAFTGNKSLYDVVKQIQYNEEYFKTQAKAEDPAVASLVGMYYYYKIKSLPLPLQRIADAEVLSEYKISVITINFECLRQHSKLDVPDPDSLQKKIEAKPPSRLFFKTQFFTFPEIKTSTATLLKAVEKGREILLLKSTESESGSLLLTFKIDPTAPGNAHQHLELCKYLYSRSLEVQIWDADTLSLFGVLTIPLKLILRKGKDMAIYTKEYRIEEQSDGNISKGLLRVTLMNAGKKVEQKEKSPPKSRPTTAGSESTKIKSKGPGYQLDKLANHPIVRDLNPQILEEILQTKDNRLGFYTQTSLGYYLLYFTSPPMLFSSYNQTNFLQDMAEFRDSMKISLVKSSKLQPFVQEITLNVKQFQPEIFCVDVVNLLDYEELFMVEVDDPAAPRPEILQIRDQVEWKFWAEKYGFTKPENWKVVSPYDGSIFLKPKEHIQVLFKYYTERPHFNQRELSSKDKSNFNKARVIKIFLKTMNKRTFSEVRVQVEPHMIAIDRTLTFYEKENSLVRLQLKGFKSGLDQQQPLLIAATQQDISLKEQNGQDLIDLSAEMGPMGQVKTFGVICYSDTFKSEILRFWTVKIHCAQQIKIKEYVYREGVHKIGFFGTSCNKVWFLSSDPYLVEIMPPYNTDFSTVEGAFNPIRVSVFADKVSTQTCLVQCISSADGTVLNSWLVELTGIQPTVSQYLEIQLKKSNIAFKYKLKDISRTPKEVEYKSSNVNLFKIERPNIDKSQDEEELSLSFDHRIRDRSEFFMYIVDKFSQNVLDCIIFCTRQ